MKLGSTDQTEADAHLEGHRFTQPRLQGRNVHAISHYLQGIGYTHVVCVGLNRQ